MNRPLLDFSIAIAFSKGLSFFPIFPFDERSTFNALMNEHALFLQSGSALHESGQLEDETYHADLEWIVAVMAAPEGSAWWVTARPVYVSRVVDASHARLDREGLEDTLDLDAYRLDGEPGVQQAVVAAAQQRIRIDPWYRSGDGLRATALAVSAVGRI